MADRHGIKVRSLAIAFALAAACANIGFAQSKSKPAPLGTPVPLGTPIGNPAITDDAGPPLTPESATSSFTLAQLQYNRVRDARLEMRYGIKKLFRDRGLRYPAADIYVRVFKREHTLELWVRPEGDTIFSLLRSYDICAQSGDLGPKRARGDNQVPEGFYTIDRFNPYSDYHLSLHVDYPNRSDQLSSAQPDLGGDIFIHGGCNSIGCLALTDEGIKQLYWVAVEARAAGQQRIPVDIFPARLEDDNMTQLSRVFAKNPVLVDFWRTLKPGYDFFEKNRILPNVRVDQVGRYVINNTPVTGLAGVSGAGAPLGTPLGAPVPRDTSAAAITPRTHPSATLGTVQPQSTTNYSGDVIPLGVPVDMPKAGTEITTGIMPATVDTVVTALPQTRIPKTTTQKTPKTTTQKPAASPKKPAAAPLGTPVPTGGGGGAR